MSKLRKIEICFDKRVDIEYVLDDSSRHSDVRFGFAASHYVYGILV